MARVAFMGAGIMGSEMIRRLLAAGHAVRVWNRTRVRVEPLVVAGATACSTPREAASGADLIVSMLSDDDASSSVWLGPAGALEAELENDTLCIESSTLSHAWIQTLARAVVARGARFLDCPVTGGPDGARAGTLTLLAGGDSGDLERARGVLGAYSDRAFLFGPVGCGTAYKLIVNLMGAAQAAALAEGMLIAERAGLDLAQTGEALRSGAVSSPLVRYMSRRIEQRSHDDVYFSAKLRCKDARYGIALAEAVGQRVPTSRAACELFERSVEEGLGHKNSSIVVEALR